MSTTHHSAYDLEIQHNLASAYDLENPGNLEIPHIRTTARHEVMLPAPSVGISRENTMVSHERRSVINVGRLAAHHVNLRSEVTHPVDQSSGCLRLIRRTAGAMQSAGVIVLFAVLRTNVLPPVASHDLRTMCCQRPMDYCAVRIRRSGWR